MAFVLSVGGAYVLARTALSSVEAVVSSAREITEGDLSRRLPVSRPKGEIGRLTTTINALLARLEAAFARREEALSRQRRFAADASHELRLHLANTAERSHDRSGGLGSIPAEPRVAESTVRRAEDVRLVRDVGLAGERVATGDADRLRFGLPASKIPA